MSVTATRIAFENRRRTSNSTGYRKEYIEDCWNKASRRVVVALTWYQATRHSFVSRCLTSGASLDEVSAAVGHSSPVVTRAYYDHFVRKAFSAKLRKGIGTLGNLTVLSRSSRGAGVVRSADGRSDWRSPRRTRCCGRGRR
jgi:integrase